MYFSSEEGICLHIIRMYMIYSTLKMKDFAMLVHQYPTFLTKCFFGTSDSGAMKITVFWNANLQKFGSGIEKHQEGLINS